MKIKIIEKNKLIQRIMVTENLTLQQAQQVYADMPQKERKQHIRRMRK